MRIEPARVEGKCAAAVGVYNSSCKMFKHICYVYLVADMQDPYISKQCSSVSSLQRRMIAIVDFEFVQRM